MPDLVSTSIDILNSRSREVFRLLVESYLDTGDPVGSRTLTRTMTETVSAATIRNVMQDLEYLGLLDSPHVSAGRIPTQIGLRMFVDGLLEVSDISIDERRTIDASIQSDSDDISASLDRAGSLLSGLTQSASVVFAPKTEAPIKHIEFVSLSADKALVVLVMADGQVENRIFKPAPRTISRNPTGSTWAGRMGACDRWVIDLDPSLKNALESSATLYVPKNP